jgi:surfactin synthase thioesterase subunit
MVADNSPEYLISLSRYVDDPEFIKSILPLMRRDYPLLKGFRYEPQPPASFPITAFAARQDDMVYSNELQEWRQHTEAGFELLEVDGDHWFLNRNRDLIVAKLEDIATKHRADTTDRQVQSTTIEASG